MYSSAPVVCRSSFIAVMAVVGVAVAVGACSDGSAGMADATSSTSDGAGASADAAPDGGGPPDGPGQWATIPGGNGQFTIRAGAQGWYCHLTQLTEDHTILGFRSAPAPAIHRAFVTVVQDFTRDGGDFPCSINFVFGRLIYAAGVGTAGLEFAPGEGVRLAAGEYLTIVYQVDNRAGTSELAFATAIEAKLGAPSDVTTELEMVFTGTTSVSIPSDGMPHYVNGSCYPPEPQTFVGGITLMGGTGVSQRLDHLAASGSSGTPIDAAFDPVDMQYLTFPRFTATSGDALYTTCNYVNSTGVTQIWGDRIENEMCYLVLYRTGPTAPTAPFSCPS